MRWGVFFGSLGGAALLAGIIGLNVAGNGPSSDRATVTGDGAALYQRVLAPPPEAVEITDQVGGTNGVFTLREFADAYFSDPSSAMQSLSDLRFQVMAERSWVAPDGIRFDDQLIQFATESKASLYLERQLRGFNNSSDVGPGFAVDGEQGTGYEAPDIDVDGSRHAYLFAGRGNLVVVVLVYAAGPLNRAEESAVLADQLEVLPR